MVQSLQKVVLSGVQINTHSREEEACPEVKMAVGTGSVHAAERYSSSVGRDRSSVRRTVRIRSFRVLAGASQQWTWNHVTVPTQSAISAFSLTEVISTRVLKPAISSCRLCGNEITLHVGRLNIVGAKMRGGGLTRDRFSVYAHTTARRSLPGMGSLRKSTIECSRNNMAGANSAIGCRIQTAQKRRSICTLITTMKRARNVTCFAAPVTLPSVYSMTIQYCSGQQRITSNGTERW